MTALGAPTRGATPAARIRSSPLVRWLLYDSVQEMSGPHEPHGHHAQQPWWKVMCLTGVDYFSTLGYQPGIAFLAATALSPIATLVLVLLTLFGALPVYSRVAGRSPHGEGSISMLERLLPWWGSKPFVLCLLGFAATDFIITITLSAADATAHIIENPYSPSFLHHRIAMTLFLVLVLGGVFLKGFKEAIGIAVVLVAVYLLLNVIVVLVGLRQVMLHPHVLSDWKQSLFTTHGSIISMIGVSLLLFPKLALGLSGFETGVAVMPLVRGEPGDDPVSPAGRIANTRKLLTSAAGIMSVMLIASAFVTTLLIPAREFQAATATHPAGQANGRALAYMAHLYLGNGFGTVYDLSTVLILWFAGASALAGLLNLVPRYLPRYGMAPDWARSTRPLVIVFTILAIVITVMFRADVDAQGGAYATGVLVLMTSAAIAVTLSVRSAHGAWWAFGIVALIFIYTTGANVLERPEGIKIAAFFILAILFTSFLSRVLRTTELRVHHIELDELAWKFVREASQGTLRVVANHCDDGSPEEYAAKEMEKREDNHIPANEPILFLEVTISDPTEFSHGIEVRGVDVGGYRVLRTESSAVPNAIAALLLFLRDETGVRPHAYFSWSEGNPLYHMMRYVIFGQGYTAPITHEVLREAERDPERRPAIHIGS